MSDFKLAKQVVSDLKIGEPTFIECESDGNFRKYLRDHSKNTGKEYVTKVIDGKMRVVRLV